MPHISVKMLRGRTNEQKELIVKKLSDALCEAIGCSESHVSVAVEDFSGLEWQDVYATEIENNENLMQAPNYDPKTLINR